MITRLRAENFKSWKDTGDLRLAPLTGLFGTNSSGKSSILQVLLMLKQTIESHDPRRVLNLGDERTLVDLGTFSEVIHNHVESLPLNLSLAWDEPIDRGFADEDTGVSGNFRATVVQVGDRMVSLGFTYSSGDQVFKVATGPSGYVYSENGASEVNVGPPFGMHGFPSDVDVFSSGRQLAFGLQICLESISYLGPLRQHPRRIYTWGGNEPGDVGRDGSEAVQALLATRNGLRTVPPVREWLKRMKLIDAFRIEPIAPNRKDYEIRLRKNAGSAEVLLPDVGFGVSQILPVLVLCYYVREGSTLILEQPELHLHPAAQSELGDLLIEVVKDRKLQIIVESHSEHLLRRIQRRVAEGAFEAKDTALYFCEMDNGESKATELQIGDDGFIKNWPNDFFGDEMGELSALTEAAIKRRLAHAK